MMGGSKKHEYVGGRGVAMLLYLVGAVAAAVYTVALVDSTVKSDLPAAVVAIGPHWLLVAVVAAGLGRLVALAEAAYGTLRRLDGWQTDAGSRVGIRRDSVVEVLRQIRDRQPPKADAG